MTLKMSGKWPAHCSAVLRVEPARSASSWPHATNQRKPMAARPLRENKRLFGTARGQTVPGDPWRDTPAQNLAPDPL